MSTFSYSLLTGGFDVFCDEARVVHQPFDPRQSGFHPIPDADRDPLARAACQSLTPGLNYHWVGDVWVEIMPAPPVLPELVIVSVTGAIYDAAKHEITTTEGTAITVNTEIHVGGVIYTPFTGTFRVPVVATDGREKVVLASVVSGAAAIAWTPKDSGIWEITQARINRDIPEVQHLSFADIKLFVLEA